MGVKDFGKVFAFEQMPRQFPVAIDAKYDVLPTDPREPFVARAFNRVETILVAADGSGDFENIQEAINALPPTGGIVYIKEGTYTITDPITLGRDKVSIIGSGKASQIKVADTHNIVATDGMITTDTFNDVVIENIFFNGNSKNVTGVRIETGVNIWVRNNWFQDCDNAGVGVIGLGALTENYVVITGNIITSGANSGIVIGNSKFSIIASNHVYGNTNRGIDLSSDSAENIINGNIVRSNTDNGINIDDADRNIISNNIVTDNGANGIDIDEDSGNNTADNNVVTGNIVYNNTNTGIILGSTVDRTLVHGNISLNNGVAQFTDGGTNTTAADNITT